MAPVAVVLVERYVESPVDRGLGVTPPAVHQPVPLARRQAMLDTPFVVPFKPTLKAVQLLARPILVPPHVHLCTVRDADGIREYQATLLCSWYLRLESNQHALSSTATSRLRVCHFTTKAWYSQRDSNSHDLSVTSS